MPRRDVSEDLPLVTGDTIFLGVDPGASGGIAYLFPDGALEVFGFSERSPQRIWKEFQRVHEASLPILGCIEKVGGYIKGAGGNIGSSMFSFGRSTGMVLGFLVAAGISYEEVAPATWQRVIVGDLKRRSEATRKWKLRLREKAMELFPNAASEITMGVADAVLLAEYGRRTHTPSPWGK